MGLGEGNDRGCEYKDLHIQQVSEMRKKKCGKKRV
jgi:hypothetical protein